MKTWYIEPISILHQRSYVWEELEEDDVLIDATKVEREHKDRVNMVEKAEYIKEGNEEESCTAIWVWQSCNKRGIFRNWRKDIWCRIFKRHVYLIKNPFTGILLWELPFVCDWSSKFACFLCLCIQHAISQNEDFRTWERITPDRNKIITWKFQDLSFFGRWLFWMI